MSTAADVIAPRVFVTCLAAYNSGHLHGKWYDVTSEPDDLRQAIQEVLATSPEPGAEEWFYTDWSGIPETIAGEYADVEDLCQWAHEVEDAEQRGLDTAAFWEYVDDQGQPEVEGIAERAADDYIGHYDSLADFAEEFVEERDGIPDARPIEMRGTVVDVLQHIDYEAIGRDLVLGGDYTTYDTHPGVYVFWNR